MQNEIHSISFIGSGNVATNLACSFHAKGIKINQIYSKNKQNAEILAKRVLAESTDSIDEINKTSDIIIVSVNDTALPEIAEKIKINGNLIVHTSGFTHMDVLQNKWNRYGVIYPLQSFVKSKITDLHKVPFCLECSNEEDLLSIENLSKKVSSAIRLIDSQKRKQLHLAAVFASNFTNCMYSVAESILTKHHISFDLLKPLITETAQRIDQTSPELLQTGPARRNDISVINEHISMLSEHDQKELYDLISKFIIQKYHKNE